MTNDVTLGVSTEPKPTVFSPQIAALHRCHRLDGEVGHNAWVASRAGEGLKNGEHGERCDGARLIRSINPSNDHSQRLRFLPLHVVNIAESTRDSQP
jgi:hypothetical protein